MPQGQLKAKGWEDLTRNFPDPEVIMAILGICTFGARIGYTQQRSTPTIYPNLATAKTDANLVSADITAELSKNRLETYSNITELPAHYTASPLGLTDKADGTKRRIHHLSYPSDSANSINSGIPEEFGVIIYSGIEDAIAAVQQLGRGCTMIKRDFESAFRHIPVSPYDSPLLGFHWENKFYAERFLPFGLRTAPYLFNLFAEVFHWILEDQLRKQNIAAQIIHYLDDFLIVIPTDQNPEQCIQAYTALCGQVGLRIKHAKDEQGTTSSFAGLEFDSREMVVRLPGKKLAKARAIVENIQKRRSASLLEIQKITGYLNFVSTVVPLGRTFLRRLYNMELYFPSGGRHHRRRISGEAKKDLAWWAQALAQAPERSIARRNREVIQAWSDAASSGGLGAFYTSKSQPQPQAQSAFSIAFPHSLTKSREHINTQEMRAVEQVLLHWGREWKGKILIIHIDNRAVVHAIANRTIRGASMQVLRRCLLLATEYDVDLQAKWISTKDNALADALSRFAFQKVANIAPQLTSPNSSHLRRGFRTFSSRDSPM